MNNYYASHWPANGSTRNFVFSPNVKLIIVLFPDDVMGPSQLTAERNMEISSKSESQKSPVMIPVSR